MPSLACFLNLVSAVRSSPGAPLLACIWRFPVVRVHAQYFRIGMTADILPTRLGSTRRNAHEREVTKVGLKALGRLSQSACPAHPNLVVGSCARGGSHL